MTIVNTAPVTTEQPFYGTPQVFSATIQAEDFDQGPSNVGYFDETPGNSGGEYRNTDVDIAPTTDVGGGFAVVNLQQNEWMRYTIDVPVTGTYRIETHVASAVGSSIFHISFDGVSTGSQTIPNTGGLENWTTLVKTASLTAGVHIMKFFVDTAKTPTTNVGSLNYIRVYRDLSATTNGVAFTAAPSLPTARQESIARRSTVMITFSADSPPIPAAIFSPPAKSIATTRRATPGRKWATCPKRSRMPPSS